MNNWYVVVLLMVSLVSVTAAVWKTVQTRRTMDRLEKMLQLATEDNFTEELFDESRLSSLETKFAHYLSANGVTARNVAEEKDKIKTLISDISHQTKTPISNLLLYSELLAEEEMSDAAGQYVESMHGQTEKLRFLIDALVKMSRLENGILVLEPEQNQVGSMLRKIQEDYQHKAEEKGLTLQVKSCDSMALYDPKWTAEAIGNLLDNAIKYTTEGSIRISVCEYEMFVRIDITDTGIGISEEEQAQIFARFYRSKEVKDAQGVGIGLYLAREIISSEGGYIKVQSQVGTGSTFSVYLPR